MTHGEAYFYRRYSSPNVALTDNSRLPKRMRRKDALRYYGDKIKKIFGTEEKIRDFLSPDDFYDFHEANHILQKIRRIIT